MSYNEFSPKCSPFFIFFSGARRETDEGIVEPHVFLSANADDVSIQNCTRLEFKVE